MRAPLVVALLLLLAGCSAPVPERPGGSTPPTPEPTLTGTPSPPADATDGNTVDYADLPPRSQRAFDAALEDTARFAPESPAVESDYFAERAADPFYDHRYVRRSGTYYEVSLQPGRLLASYHIHASLATPDGDETAVAYGNLSDDVSDEVRGAIENGSYDVPMGRWSAIPEELRDVDLVRYRGERYRLHYVVGDYRVLELSVREVS